MRISMLIFLPLSFLSTSTLAYELVREYSGETFFDRWSFYNKYDDLTNGDVIYLDKSTAQSSKLVGVNSANNVILKVDNTSTVPWNEKRNSVRIDSTDSYPLGSLWVIDVVHMPFGCSSRLAWLLALRSSVFTGETWPQQGEIDIIEAVNKMNHNQMALHTLTGCTQAPEGVTAQLGTQGFSDCNAQNASAGCTVADSTTKVSFGPSFNQNGGGVWATQFDESGVFIWFWERASVPDALKRSNTATTLDISSFGSPVAAYPSSTCNMSKFFGPQTLVLDTTLCGDWAGEFNTYGVTCSSQPANTPNPGTPAPGISACYLNNVVGPGSPLYDEAYFEISHIRTYATGSAVPSSTGSSAGTSAGAAGTSGSSGGNGNGAVAFELKNVGMTGLVAFAGIVFRAMLT